MIRTVLPCWLLFAFLMCACEDRKGPFAERPVKPSPIADERLALLSPRREYLVGEPVLLDLKFQNLSKETIKVLEVVVQPDHYETRLRIAQGTDPFLYFSPNGVNFKRDRRVVSLEPAEHLTYSYRVLGSLRPKFELAFAKPAEYRVCAVYPLQVSTERPVEIASNVVEVRVKEPVGEDAQVWRQLDDPSFLTLLQSEVVDEQRKEVPLKMAEILRNHPTSGYAPALRFALSRVYFRHRFGLPQADVSRLSSILGISDLASFDDVRLTVLRKPPFDATKLSPKEARAKLQEKRPVSDILSELTEASGVKLEASAAIKAAKAEFSKTFVLDCMQSLSDELEASWVQQGEGYFLAPFQPAHNKQTGKKGRE